MYADKQFLTYKQHIGHFVPTVVVFIDCRGRGGIIFKLEYRHISFLANAIVNRFTLMWRGPNSYQYPSKLEQPGPFGIKTLLLASNKSPIRTSIKPKDEGCMGWIVFGFYKPVVQMLRRVSYIKVATVLFSWCRAKSRKSCKHLTLNTMSKKSSNCQTSN
jgi:hypothetical protein